MRHSIEIICSDINVNSQELSFELFSLGAIDPLWTPSFSINSLAPSIVEDPLPEIIVVERIFFSKLLLFYDAVINQLHEVQPIRLRQLHFTQIDRPVAVWPRAPQGSPFHHLQNIKIFLRSQDIEGLLPT
jgi:hypothetical protein